MFGVLLFVLLGIVVFFIVIFVDGLVVVVGVGIEIGVGVVDFLFFGFNELN